jgi:NAD(P)-dependent dehydrogenase (short-subunit alcohol dehydrogenase family)
LKPINSAGKGGMAQRIILITGASRGIGLAAAAELIERGAHVIGTARSMEALAGAARRFGSAFTPFAAEMASRDDLIALRNAVTERFGRLDGLFGNAGILGTKIPVGSLEDDDFERTMAINVTSSYRLLHLFDPLLRKSEAGRVLFATSGVAWKRYSGWTLYALSKAALETMTGVYANEIADTPIRANLISPGPIRTEMRVEAWPEEDPSSVPLPEAVAPVIADLLSPQTVENGAIYDFQLGRFTRGRRPD